MWLLFLLISSHFSLSLGKSVQFYSEDVDLVVDRHNELRGRVARGEVEGQPPASNMQKLKWHQGISSHAQNIANRCGFEHSIENDDYKLRIRLRESYGLLVQGLSENLGESYEGNITQQLEDIINMWYMEHFDFQHPDQSYGDKETGHYKNMLDASSTLLGCGFADCRFEGHNFILVCQYASTKERSSPLIYKTGNPCVDEECVDCMNNTFCVNEIEGNDIRTTTPKQIFGNTATEIKQFGTTTSEAKQFGNTTSEVEQFGNTTSEVEQFGNTTFEVEQFGNTTSEVEQFGNTESDVVPVSTTFIEPTVINCYLPRILAANEYSRIFMSIEGNTRFAIDIAYEIGLRLDCRGPQSKILLQLGKDSFRKIEMIEENCESHNNCGDVKLGIPKYRPETSDDTFWKYPNDIFEVEPKRGCHRPKIQGSDHFSQQFLADQDNLYYAIEFSKINFVHQKPLECRGHNATLYFTIAPYPPFEVKKAHATKCETQSVC